MTLSTQKRYQPAAVFRADETSLPNPRSERGSSVALFTLLENERFTVHSESQKTMPTVLRILDASDHLPNQEYVRKVDVIPTLHWAKTGHFVSNEQIRRLLHCTWAIVVSRALQCNFPITETLIDSVEDPDEEQGRIVLRIFSKVQASQALAFWDSLESDMQEWLARLPEKEQSIFLGRLGFRVHWA